MLDQDTARALLAIADETGARLALLGDRQQLPAVGRGGVLELARAVGRPAARVELDVVHRFTRETRGEDGTPTRVPDPVYALITLQMRDGDDPAGVFDYLHTRGLVRLHDCEAEPAAGDRRRAWWPRGRRGARRRRGRHPRAGRRPEQRDPRPAGHRRTGRRPAHGRQPGWSAGRCRRPGRHPPQRPTPRRGQPRGLDRHRRTPRRITHCGRRAWPAGAARRLRARARRARPTPPPRTAPKAPPPPPRTSLLGEHTTAASGYVGMTRGREANTVHLSPTDLDDARDQWVDAFSRDRADLGPAHAAERAAAAGRRLHRRPSARPGARRAARGMARTSRPRARAATRHRTTRTDRRGDRPARAARPGTRRPRGPRPAHARATAEQARAEADTQHRRHRPHAQQIRDQLLQRWDQQREQARRRRRGLCSPDPAGSATDSWPSIAPPKLSAHWSTAWQPYLPDMPTSTERDRPLRQLATQPHRIAEAFDTTPATRPNTPTPNTATCSARPTHAEQQWQQDRRAKHSTSTATTTPGSRLRRTRQRQRPRPTARPRRPAHQRRKDPASTASTAASTGSATNPPSPPSHPAGSSANTNAGKPTTPPNSSTPAPHRTPQRPRRRRRRPRPPAAATRTSTTPTQHDIGTARAELRTLTRISAQLVRGKGSADFVAQGAVSPPGHGGVVGECGCAECG